VGEAALRHEPHGSSGGRAYERHRPEKTVLYRTVARHWPAFLGRAEEHGGLPRAGEGKQLALFEKGGAEGGRSAPPQALGVAATGSQYRAKLPPHTDGLVVLRHTSKDSKGAPFKAIPVYRAILGAPTDPRRTTTYYDADGNELKTW
jgi:hypothetical protein